MMNLNVSRQDLSNEVLHDDFWVTMRNVSTSIRCDDVISLITPLPTLLSTCFFHNVVSVSIPKLLNTKSKLLHLILSLSLILHSWTGLLIVDEIIVDGPIALTEVTVDVPN